jgi:hypothetical protein
VSSFVFIGVTRAVRKTQFCQSLVISCSRMRGEYPVFRDTLIVRRAGSNDCKRRSEITMFSMIMGLVVTSVIGLIIAAEVSVE